MSDNKRCAHGIEGAGPGVPCGSCFLAEAIPAHHERLRRQAAVRRAKPETMPNGDVRYKVPNTMTLHDLNTALASNSGTLPPYSPPPYSPPSYVPTYKRRTWRERLWSWPWRPWRSWRKVGPIEQAHDRTKWIIKRASSQPSEPTNTPVTKKDID